MNMKKNIMWILLILSMIVVIVILMYIGKTIVFNDQGDTATEQSTPTEDYSDPVLPPADLDSATDDSNVVMALDTHHYVYVGDSRYVGMSQFKSDTDTFICENGVGRYFLDEKMNDIIDAASDGNSRIVIGLGVNDINSSEEYVDLLAKLVSKTDVEVFYMLVNPVDESMCSYNGYNITNNQIDSFNSKMIDGLEPLGIKLIDTNSFLKGIGFDTSDGLHYSNETYFNILRFIRVSLAQYK